MIVFQQLDTVMYTTSRADGETVDCVKAAELEFKKAVQVAVGAIEITGVADEVAEGDFVRVSMQHFCRN